MRTNLQFKFKSSFIVAFLVLCMQLTFAQETSEITGKITTQEGVPLPFINVLVKGTTMGTTTDFDGNYNIIVASDAMIIFSYVGYKTQEVPVEGRTEINVQLLEDVSTLDEVVVVGYGTQKRTSISSAVSEISNDALSSKPMSDVRQMLQGEAPGLNIVDQGGGPGNNNIRMLIRGNTTLGGTQPLILVDGIEQNLSDLNPDNIQSISILKDASATSIYGSRGANGVILVTSKNPKANDLSFSYNGSYGIESPTITPEHLGVEEYLRLQNVAQVNAGNVAPYTEDQIQQYVQNVNQGNLLEYPLPNAFFNEVFNPGPIQNHQIAIGGGSEKVRSRLSGQILSQDGILPNYNFKRLEIRSDNSIHPTDWISIDASLTYRRKDLQEPYNTNGVIFDIWHGSQWGVPQYPNGVFGNNSVNKNPLRDATLRGTSENISHNFIGNFKAKIEIGSHLDYTFQFGGNQQFNHSKRFQNRFQIFEYDVENMVLTDKLLFSNSNNSLEENKGEYRQLTLRNLLNYNNIFGKNEVNLLLGYEEIKTDNNNLFAFRQNFYSNSLQVINAGSLENLNNGGFATEERLRSGFSRLNYSYDDKYLFEANARYDGSSKFYGSDNQYGFFPSFSTAWRMSNEKFWKGLSETFSDLKLRGSWGITGNNTVALYTFFPGLNIGSNYSFGGNLVSTAASTGLVNQDLTWEETTQTNFGLDAEFWGGLLNFSFDLWNKKTEGILLALPVPATVGFEGSPQNAGRVDNSGWDFSFQHRDIVSDDFNYTLSGNISNFHNEVVDLAGTGPYISETSIIKEGESLNSIWGYKSLGLFQSQEEIENSATYAGTNNTFPGDMKFADLNNDGRITPEDKTVIGSSDPHYSFGLNLGMNYKNFDFGMLLQGVGEQDRIPIGASIEGGNWLGFTLDVINDYYTPDNPDAFIPRPQKNSRKNNTPEVLSDKFVVDASYVRLKNIQFGYSIPKSSIEKFGAKNLRFYVSGTNVFTISESKKWGLDPEFQSGRLGYYYQTSQYVVGAQISL